METLQNGWVIAAVLWIGFGKVLLSVVFERLTSSSTVREHRVFRIEPPSAQWWREVRSSWHVISDGAVLALLLATGTLRLSPTTPGSALFTFVVFYAWVETYYYFGHRTMHRSKFLYRFHRTHHLTKVVTPTSSMSMSLVEKMFLYTGGWLGFMTLVSWVAPVSLGGLAAYYTFHFIISLHGHSNVETSSLGLLMGRFGMGSATSHAVHHARPHANFGFSNLTWDRLCRTYDEQTPELQENALRGRGASELRAPSRAPATRAHA